MSSDDATLAAELTAHLTSKGVPPSRTWLTTVLLPSLRTNAHRRAAAPPLAATKQTALFRLLAADITICLAHSPTANRLPQSIANGVVKELIIPGPVAVQVLDVEDVGRSRWSQVEALEARERGEMTKGREIIRVADNVEGGEEEGGGGGGEGGARTQQSTAAAAEGSSDPHKLLLVDAAGTRVYGFELVPVPGVSIEKMGIGAKLVLRNAVVARGVVLLEPRTTTCLGGKVEALDKVWRDGRLTRLKEAAKMEER